MAIALYTLMTDLKKAKRWTGVHTLIVASRYGHDKVVKMLLAKFNPDLEQEGTVKFDGYVIEGASALWCAACAEQLALTEDLDIVKYLTYHNANIHIANKYNNTCLMIASYKGHLDVVSFLLENGANPNEKALCGATALHFAAECGYVDVVRELLKYNAKFSVKRWLPELTKEERIEALELLGASYANDKENYDLVKAYKYMHMSMELRYEDPDNPIKKNLIPPVPAYENWVECQTLYELEAIQGNNNSLHMEALTIRERILGTQNPEVPHPVIYRGAVFADNARFDRRVADGKERII
ncbi:hypothetical protein NQ317_001757 [Molorchus minor]|uniref:Protein fem-1 homolog B n=1 Tax=Molorchus minor TaxID=1323400 RepID=A0ABQ9JHF4_9CUCU|nr:hypothetical protein NQ317_001757 [Molorchus minor]